MSSFTSAMAFSWSGVSTYGKASSISRCHGVSGPKAWPGGLDALLVQHHQLLGDRAHLGPHPALGLGEVVAAQAVQRRRLAADVVAHRVDLVGRHVELVAALVLEEQVVALDAADGRA